MAGNGNPSLAKKYLQSSKKYLLAQVSCSLASVPHPALRAIFSFLTSKDESYTSVLEEDGLLLVDRYLLELLRNIGGAFNNLIVICYVNQR